MKNSLVIFSILTFSATGFSQGPPTHSVEAIHQNASGMYGKISDVKVQYAFSGKSVAEEDSTDLLASLPDVSQDVTYSVFEDKRRKITVHLDSDFREENIYDGQHNFKLGPGSVSVESGKASGMESDIYTVEGLQFAHSDTDVANYDNGWFYPHVLRSVNGSSKYVVMPELEKVDDAWCHVVEYPGFDKIWVDEKMNFAIRKRERSELVGDTKLMLASYHFADFKEIQGVHAAFSISRKIFSNAGTPRDQWNKVVRVSELSVKSLEINSLESSQFNPQLDPGTIIIGEDGTNVRVPGASPVTLDKLADVASGVIKKPASKLRGIVMIANVILIAAVALFFLLRKKKESTKAAE